MYMYPSIIYKESLNLKLFNAIEIRYSIID